MSVVHCSVYVLKNSLEVSSVRTFSTCLMWMKEPVPQHLQEQWRKRVALTYNSDSHLWEQVDFLKWEKPTLDKETVYGIWRVLSISFSGRMPLSLKGITTSVLMSLSSFRIHAVFGWEAAFWFIYERSQSIILIQHQSRMLLLEGEWSIGNVPTASVKGRWNGTIYECKNTPKP